MNTSGWFATVERHDLAVAGGPDRRRIARLAWFGYRATDEWQRSSALLVDRRADEVANTLTTALARDMRRVQTILDGREWAPSLFTSPYEVIDVVAGAFARYPYPEVFFGWQSDATTRCSSRGRNAFRPGWLRRNGGQYPVAVLRNRAVADGCWSIDEDVKARRTHSIFEVDIDGSTYQVIARTHHRHQLPRRRSGRLRGAGQHRLGAQYITSPRDHRPSRSYRRRRSGRHRHDDSRRTERGASRAPSGVDDKPVKRRRFP